MRIPRIMLLGGASVLLLASAAWAKQPVQIYTWSQQNGPSHATTGGSVHVSTPAAGNGGSAAKPGSPASGRPGGPESSSPPAHGGGTVSPYPSVTSNSPILTKPRGPNSFWYRTPGGQQCLYTAQANATAVCVNVVHPGTPATPAAPPLNPTTLATDAAKHLLLGTGRVSASPSASTAGLTGTPSWFWLTPAPAASVVTVTRGGERVSVTAKERSVDWSFGDNGTLDAGPGIPYQPGSVPAGAVTHDYQTRCLPGDQGHDPDVLPTCGSSGYTITATVGWTITYTATGPVTRAGALASRTTATSTSYPVTEVRGFLSSAGSA